MSTTMATNNDDSNTSVVPSSLACSKCRKKCRCVQPYCLNCLHKISNNCQNINCDSCIDESKELISKQCIHCELYVLDTRNVADHVLINKKFVVKLKSKNVNCKSEYDKDLKVTGMLIRQSVVGDAKKMDKEDNFDGTYDLSGCCDKEGEWELCCYINEKLICKAPLKVVKEGFYECPNIFREEESTRLHMFDIVDDTVYACGEVNNEITRFSLEGKRIGTIYGHRSWQFTSLCCVNIEGDLLIVCYDKYMAKLMFYEKENWHESGGKKIGYVSGKIMSHDDKIYVPDYNNNCVLCFSLKGKLLDEIKGAGDYKNVKLSLPYGVAMTKNGDMLVLSNGCNEVIKINKKDKKAAVFIDDKTTGGPPKLLKDAYAIAVDERDLIIIGGYGKLLLFDQDGKFIKDIDSQNAPHSPYSIFCRNGCIWVADKKYSSLHVYYYSIETGV